jgi:hypothetical protein
MRAWASDVSSVSLNNSFCSRPEALDEGILHGFARRDLVLCDAALIDPWQDGIADQLAAVVADHHLRLPRSITDRSGSRATPIRTLMRADFRSEASSYYTPRKR